MKSIIVLLLSVCCGMAYADVPANRLATLSRGVNVTTVFDMDEKFPQLINDIPTMKQLGFRHIRIFIDPDWVAHWYPTDAKLSHLDRVVDAATKQNLGVILCMAGSGWTDDKVQSTLAHWIVAWKTLATHYRSISPDKMFYELVNEPTLSNVDQWARVQEALRQPLRAVAPQNTLLLTSTPDSTVWGLSALPPTKDTNVAYTFHLYQPMMFSHQGADWAGTDPRWKDLQLEYPPNSANISAIQRRVPSLSKDLTEYANSGVQAIDKEISVGRNWAKQHNAHIVVTEFGVYHPAPPKSRTAWLEQARNSIENAGFGWSIWEWDSGFGVKQDLAKGCSPASLRHALGMCG